MNGNVANPLCLCILLLLGEWLKRGGLGDLFM